MSFLVVKRDESINIFFIVDLTKKGVKNAAKTTSSRFTVYDFTATGPDT